MMGLLQTILVFFRRDIDRTNEAVDFSKRITSMHNANSKVAGRHVELRVNTSGPQLKKITDESVVESLDKLGNDVIMTSSPDADCEECRGPEPKESFDHTPNLKDPGVVELPHETIIGGAENSEKESESSILKAKDTKDDAFPSIADGFSSLGNILSFSFMSEKKIDNGEDSEPLLLLNDGFSVIGVFDGMGGAGSALHIMGDVEKTGAYIASRKVKDATELFFTQWVNDNSRNEFNSERIADELKESLKLALALLKEECPPKLKSGLKSAMIKEFPTTLAIAVLQRKDDDFLISSFWAGDSRNYLLTPKGIFQISIDDLVAKGDPYENLSSDSPLSNQICADREFSINKLDVSIADQHFVVFSVTDGCFGYYPTPLHFEDALLRNLSQAASEQEWMCLLRDEFSEVAADDTSMSCVIYGFDDFRSFKESMSERMQYVEGMIAQYDVHKRMIDEAKASVAQLETDFKEYKREVWEQYKVDYMSFIS